MYQSKMVLQRNSLTDYYVGHLCSHVLTPHCANTSSTLVTYVFGGAILYLDCRTQCG